MFLQILFLGPILFVPPILEHDVVDFPHARFRIPYLVDANDKSKIDHIRVVVSTDQGKNWKHETDFKLGDDLKFQAPKDGLYWLTVQSVFKDGRKSSLSAPVKVFVNTQSRPVIRLRQTQVAVPRPPEPEPGAAAQGSENRRELEKFQGKWTPVSTIFDGKAIEGDVIKDRFTVIKGSKMTAMHKEAEISTSSIKIDPGKSPAHFDTTLTNGAKVLKGIYKFEGDTLTICIGSFGDRPTEFASPPGSGMMLYVLKRAK